jgi:hypothetical protein
MKKTIVFIAAILFFIASSFAQQKTSFGKETGEYGSMLYQLENSMMHYQEKWVKTLGGKTRNVFVPWIRDHVHVMKAMKYLHPVVTSFIEFYTSIIIIH